MSKRMRLLLILFCAGLGAVFLYPTIRWYFLIDPEIKALTNSNREEIRLAAEDMASAAATSLEALSSDLEAVENPIPEEYDFLIDIAKRHYRQLDKKIPATWTLGAVLNGFRDLDEVRDSIENYHRESILNLKDVRNRILALGLDISGGLNVVLEPDFTALEESVGRELSAEDRDAALESALEVINNRIDTFGVSEPQIRKQIDNSILVEIPGEADSERIDAFLMGRGSLSFHIVDDDATQAIRDYTAKGGEIIDGRPTEEGILDEGVTALGYYTKDSYGIDQFIGWIAVPEAPGLEGTHIREVRTDTDPNDLSPIVTFRLDPEGATIFQTLTSENINKNMAVVLGDKVKAYARISKAIPGGNVVVTGFDADQADDLAVVLRTGSLPVQLGVRSLQSVGASLGADTIRIGLRAILIGFAAVFVFMVLWYKGAGIIADIALIINLFLLISLLSSFNFTLTMTSIAGLILTVGMSVDANVIIFERIKEELRLGKGRSSAIDTGFKKAFWTVMDAQITTLIAALFLSQVGKGPVQGFAITLAWGIGCSLFTALYVARLFFDIGTESFKRQKVSIAWGVS